jgi:mRNA-degrading endonuclease YafQ of YafQ-DinJ toxin-antitoxin module
MLKLHYSEQFYKDLEDIKDKTLRERIVKKTLEFENGAGP